MMMMLLLLLLLLLLLKDACLIIHSRLNLAVCPTLYFWAALLAMQNRTRRCGGCGIIQVLALHHLGKWLRLILENAHCNIVPSTASSGFTSDQLQNAFVISFGTTVKKREKVAKSDDLEGIANGIIFYLVNICPVDWMSTEMDAKVRSQNLIGGLVLRCSVHRTLVWVPAAQAGVS